jgi:hypothetical protein
MNESMEDQQEDNLNRLIEQINFQKSNHKDYDELILSFCTGQFLDSVYSSIFNNSFENTEEEDEYFFGNFDFNMDQEIELCIIADFLDLNIIDLAFLNFLMIPEKEFDEIFEDLPNKRIKLSNDCDL